jgi:hypothetical protein
MWLSKVLREAGDLLRHVYFPLDSSASLAQVMGNGEAAENSVVGNKKVIGIALFMGGETTPAGRSYERRRRLSARRTKTQE